MTAEAARGVVIIGSGLAGYTTAREFRKLDTETPITLVTADGGEVYAKPMLSNAFAQKKTPDTLIQKVASIAAADFGGTVLARHQVMAIDRTAKTLKLVDEDGQGKALSYRQLVLALGADPRPYNVQGNDVVPVATVNDLDAYRRWCDTLPAEGRVLLIGAGLIGCEFANDLLIGGYEVTIVDPSPWPLGRLVPQALGDALAEALRDAGAKLHLGHAVSRLAVAAQGDIAILDDGTTVQFDKALSAIGLVPRVTVAREAGLTVAQGIVVDHILRTSDPDIFAIGDCAQTPVGVLSFVLPLMAQARAVAATLAGRETPLKMAALPVAVKTPALPVSVCSPKFGTAGDWQIEGTGRDLKAIFMSTDGPAGFVLSGARASERQALAKTMPDLL